LIPIEEIESAQATMSASDFNQEIMAMFVTKAGMVYSDFNDKSVIDDLVSIKDLEIGLGIDFGYANPTAIAFMAYNQSTEQVIQFDEIYKERTPIESICKDIEEKLQLYSIRKSDVKLYTDPAGNAEELSSGVSPVDFLRKKGFKVYNKGTEIAPGIALVRKFIRSADGRRSFFIQSSCKESIRSMNGYTYETNKQNDKIIKEEPLKDGLHDHACDAIRYYFVNRFDHAKYVAFKPDIDDYTKRTEALKKTANIKRCPNCRKTYVSKTPKNEPPFLCPDCIGDRQYE
jgi:hypothetical protein